MRRLVLVVAILCFLLPVLSLAASPSPAQEVATIERQTSHIRQLTLKHPVKAEFPTDPVFNQLLINDEKSSSPPAEIDLSQRESVVLGFLKPSDDLRKLLFQNMTSQVAGFYDYHTKVLYLRRNSGKIFGVERFDIAHEYTHALQDGNFNLQRLLPDEFKLKVRNSDAVSAHHALTEGDAVNTQDIFIFRTYNQADLNALYKLAATQPSIKPLPAGLQRQFDFPYTTGLTFVQALYKKGGMAAVTAAYHRLPASTFEIMHPGAYQKRWKPVRVTLNGVTGFDTWTQVDDDVFGALGYNLLIWQFQSRKAANTITNAYRGDRYVFLENGQQSAMLMISVWNSNRAARAAAKALVTGLKRRYPSTQISSGNGTTVVEKDGAWNLRVQGTRVIMTFAPTAALAQQLAQAPRS